MNPTPLARETCALQPSCRALSVLHVMAIVTHGLYGVGVEVGFVLIKRSLYALKVQYISDYLLAVHEGNNALDTFFNNSSRCDTSACPFASRLTLMHSIRPCLARVQAYGLPRDVQSMWKWHAGCHNVLTAQVMIALSASVPPDVKMIFTRCTV